MARCPRTIQHLAQSAVMLCTFGITAAGYLRLCLRSSASLAAEHLFLRKPLALYQEPQVKPQRATAVTRWTLIWRSHGFDWRQALTVVQPETCSRWQRQGIGLFRRWPSCPGRPPMPVERQGLIRHMAHDHRTWGERRIANALRLTLGLQVAPRTVRKSLPTRLHPAPGQRVPVQRWHPFRRHHAWDLIVRGMASDLSRRVQPLTARIRWRLQRCRRPTVASELRVTSPRDATCLSRLGAPTLGLAVWSPVIVEVIGVDQRSPPDGGPSCVHAPGLTSRATSVNRCDVCPAGAGLCWRHRASPRTRSVRSWSKGGSRVAPWRRAA